VLWLRVGKERTDMGFNLMPSEYDNGTRA
jgi:hypothetical protein